MKVLTDNLMVTYKTMNSGKLVVICGIDGSGKTTLEQAIAREFGNLNQPILITKQPTDEYRRNEYVRGYLDNGRTSISMEALALLSAFDRAVHIDSVIKPALESGKWVLCNRYVYSAYAYFENRGVTPEFTESINSNALMPDFGILLDLPAEVACSRVAARDASRSKFEEKNIGYMEGVRRSLLKYFPEKFLTLDGTLPEDKLCKMTMNYINQKM